MDNLNLPKLFFPLTPTILLRNIFFMLFLQTTKFSPFRRGTAYELSREISGKKLMELSKEGDKI